MEAHHRPAGIGGQEEAGRVEPVLRLLLGQAGPVEAALLRMPGECCPVDGQEGVVVESGAEGPDLDAGRYGGIWQPLARGGHGPAELQQFAGADQAQPVGDRPRRRQVAVRPDRAGLVECGADQLAVPMPCPRCAGTTKSSAGSPAGSAITLVTSRGRSDDVVAP